MDFKFDDIGMQPKVKEAFKELAEQIPEGGNKAANVPTVSAPDASASISAEYTQAEIQTIATLANANKAAINALISALVSAGLMEGA